ncbi:MAG TPA: fumarylacetoacetate hydrolase family protein [Thermomicrobiales bacterium]|jgi:acylpyruvate hydrolase
MKLVTIRTANGTRAGRLDGDTVVELPDSDVGAILAGGAASLAAAASADGPRHPYADVDLAPVVPRPPKIICIGQNYMAHIAEMGSTPPKFPTLFAKYTRALIGPRDEITLPKASEKMDWEVELAIVIGSEGRHLTAENAMDVVAGYTVLNDVSARDFQRRTEQWLQGKTFEGTTPVGPVLVTKDELDPSDLALTTEIDGQTMQSSRTSDLLFKPAEILAYISQIITLEPGDIIATGTPSGVGSGRNPQVWLQAGQTVTCTVEGIGSVVNRCVAEA